MFFPTIVLSGPNGIVRVVDGDTIWVDESKVRIHGIDTPELSQTCRTEQGVNWACGQWAKEQAKAAFEGRLARCEAVTTDRYGRIVAACSVDGHDIGEMLVGEGIAFAFRKYSNRYVSLEVQAKALDRGLWAGQVQSPSQFRLLHRAANKATTPSRECNIKGNISSKGEKIYHIPGQRYYSKTKISPQKGERWFCSESEARAAGWRRSRV